MKFTVDTEKKILTLLEPTTFRELNSIKKFIGEDASSWSIEAKEVVKDIHHYDYWWYRPYYGNYPVLTTTTQPLNTCSFEINTANANQVFFNATETQLSTTTIHDLIGQ